MPSKPLLPFQLLSALFLLLIACSCSSDSPDVPKGCGDADEQLVSPSLLADSLSAATIVFEHPWYVEGQVASSDESGNFYREIYLQDPEGVGPAIVLHTDLIESHKVYPVGSLLRVSLQGACLKKSDGLLHVGSVEEIFGNPVLGPIPAPLLADYIPEACVQPGIPVVESLDISGLAQALPGTLVRLDSVQFTSDAVGQAFATTGEDRLIQLEDCQGATTGLFTSGYADFRDQSVPAESLSITGVLIPGEDALQIAVRTFEDIRILGSRCPMEPELEVAAELLITEVADPENLPAARFVELHNPTEERVRLDGWSLERYTNDGLEPGSIFVLDGFVLEPRGLLVIARDSSVFRQTYGFLPAGEAGRNSVADSNGDDNLLLRKPGGSVADLLGRIGEDGSGTDHEFEDGRAYRKAEIGAGNAVFEPSEWVFWNDTGASGTINLPQQAPQDFDPGERN